MGFTVGERDHPSLNRCVCLLIHQDLQQVMVSGPNLNETSIVSGGYGGPAGGIIPTSSIKGTAKNFAGFVFRSPSVIVQMRRTLVKIH